MGDDIETSRSPGSDYLAEIKTNGHRQQTRTDVIIH